MQDSNFVRYLVAGVATLALILAMDTLRLFGSEQWLGMFVRVDSQYFYALFALLLPVAYLVYPTKAWIDWPLALLSFGIL